MKDADGGYIGADARPQVGAVARRRPCKRTPASARTRWIGGNEEEGNWEGEGVRE
jgi:hypothetical protein